MFELTIGSNVSRKVVAYSLDKTPKQALEDNGIDYSVGSVRLDGRAIDINKSFKDLGVGTAARLIVVVKADAAR